MIKKILTTLLLSFCSLAGAVTATFTPDTTTTIPNPGRGWYLLAGSLLDTSGNFDASLGIIISDGFRLALAETALPTSGTLSGGQLAQMQTNFNAARTRGTKLIVLFNYGGGTNDPVLSVIQAQIAQIKPVMLANRDVISFVKAGFIGESGEWADSANGNDTKANKRAIKDLVLDMTPPEISVQFSNIYAIMEDWYTGLPVLNGSVAFNGSKQSRTGQHSDCFLTGQGDSFQFTGPNTVKDFMITSSNAQQRAYAAAMSEFAPFGGETCGTSPVGTPNPPDESSGSRVQKRIDCTGQTDETGQSGGIMNEGPRYHLAWLNQSYSALFTNTWINGDSQGVKCYPQITNLLGYRFQYDNITHAATAAKGSVATFTVAMRNVGWSRLFDTRTLQVLGVSGSNSFVGYSSAKLSACPSQATTSNCQMVIHVAIPAGQASGTYTIYLQMPSVYSTTQTRNFTIRPANANNGSQVWDDSAGRMPTGTSISVP